MRSQATLFTLLISIFSFALVVAPAEAQATRTWVSGVGDDANPCSRTAPCKTFAGAISKTAAAGEINCLDPGGFGAVTITKAITIQCQAGTAGVLVSGTNGIVVAAGATDTVDLKGLDLEGLGATAGSLSGVSFVSGGALRINDCVIRGFQAGSAGNGIDFAPNGTVTAKLYIENTVVADNGNATTGSGIVVEPKGGALADVQIKHVQSSNNLRGMQFDGTGGAIQANVVDSSATGSVASGIVALGANSVRLLIDRVSSTNNGGDGIRSAGTGDLIELTRSTVTGNALGLDTAGGGIIASYGDNQIDHNTSDGVAPTPIAHR
jgi:hypothetical protein